MDKNITKKHKKNSSYGSNTTLQFTPKFVPMHVQIKIKIKKAILNNDLISVPHTKPSYGLSRHDITHKLHGLLR